MCLCGCNEPLPETSKSRQQYLRGHRTSKIQQTIWKERNPERYKAKRERERESRRKYPPDEWAAIQRAQTERRWIRESLESRLAAVGIFKSSVIRHNMRLLAKTWQNIMSWAEYAASSPCIVPDPDPEVSGECFIYGLVDPRTKMIRYVGLSTTGIRRPKEHRRAAKHTRHLYSARWIESLRGLGLTYEIVILEVCPDDNFDLLCKTEVWWIAYGRASGWELTNLTLGGEGTPGHQISTEERVLRSARAKALWEDPDYRRRTLSASKDTGAASARMKRNWQNPNYRALKTEQLKTNKRHTGDSHHMKRPEVRENQRVAMQIVGRRRAKQNFRRKWFRALMGKT